MLKVGKYFLWLVIVLVLLIGFDQLLMRMRMEVPVLQQSQTFYLDFRTRLLNLVSNKSDTTPKTIDAVIEQTAKPKSAPSEQLTRYLYVDDSGTLQFADSLQQVPAKYRNEAQPLAE